MKKSAGLWNLAIALKRSLFEMFIWNPPLEKIVKSGGEIFQPKIAVPGVGWAAYCKDSEGNIFGLMQEDPSAK